MMEYNLSIDQFYGSKMFDTNKKLYHKVGYKFKLFPFVTQPNSVPVVEFTQLVGAFLCRVENKKPEGFTVSELVDRLKEDTEIEHGSEDIFYEVVRQMFFFSDGRIRPLNLQLLAQVPCKEVSESKVAEYLVDTLGDKDVLKDKLLSVESKLGKTNNVFERLILEHLKYISDSTNSEPTYFRITNSLKQTFEDDFAYILENQTRIREYLVPLLEFYFFSYTVQACMQLDRFMDGQRNNNIPLYFCLEWEKTSQSRLCFMDGWNRLQYSVSKMFAHAVVLEILNQTDSGINPMDYISIASIIRDDENMDNIIAAQIDSITACYREAITDCPEMSELQKNTNSINATSDAISYLFSSVKTQFENTSRVRAYSSYASKFESFCKKNFLKSRGRSGLMLTLTEETLIFLTKISIKNQEQLRLRDVFLAFETRGVFLDDISKEQVADYYEKLNLIEKKSDSGDAKYVKRIL